MPVVLAGHIQVLIERMLDLKYRTDRSWEMQTLTDTIENNRAALPTTGNWSWQQARIHLWVGLAFVLLFLVTVLMIAPRIQQDLDVQTKQRLQQAGINPATLQLEWSYRDLMVKGYLPENISHQKFATIVRGSDDSHSALFAKGIRHLHLDIDIAPVISQSEESVSVEIRGDGSEATLDGVVQDDVQRDLLVQAILDTGIEDVYDNLDVAGQTGTPLMNEKISLLAGIVKETGPQRAEKFDIQMTEEDLYYRITAADKKSALAIDRAAAVKIDDFRITGGVDLPGSERLDILVQASGETITLSGNIRSEAHRKRLLFASAEAVGDGNVVDQLQLNPATFSAPESFAQIDSIAAVISRFAPGITGEVSLMGADLAVSATAGSDAVRDYLLASTDAARSAGLRVTESIVVALPPNATMALQAELDKLIDEVRERVVFASGDSELTPDAKQTLDKVAAQISDFSDLLVEIEGHTDNVGRASVNEQLSQNRANAVRNYLTQSAVDSSRLIAVGYGHRRPIDDNDTAEGRQANRRVHFTVLKRPENNSG